MPSRRYNLILLLAALLTLLPVLLLNLLLGRYTLDDGNKVRTAAEWQRQSHGRAYLPTTGSDGLFKLARLNDELPQLNGVIFGASTAETIPTTLFPAPMKLYNYAQHGHELHEAVREAEALLDQQPTLRWLVIPLDWSVGFLFDPRQSKPANMARPDFDHLTTPPISLRQRLLEALSYPRIAGLAGIFRDVMRSPQPASAFRQYFLQAASDPYRCPDGQWARDFDTLYRGRCAGLAWDGSANFAESERVGNAAPLVANALVASSKYAGNISRTQGEPNAELLARIATLARRVEQRGGAVILFMPPLLTGMEQGFVQHPQYGAYLRRTKQALGDWAQRERLVIFDAGQSERFGCVAQEFIDQHHAVPSCYQKIWGDYWQRLAQMRDGQVHLPAPGLYAGKTP